MTTITVKDTLYMGADCYTVNTGLLHVRDVDEESLVSLCGMTLKDENEFIASKDDLEREVCPKCANALARWSRMEDRLYEANGWKVPWK